MCPEAEPNEGYWSQLLLFQDMRCRLDEEHPVYRLWCLEQVLQGRGLGQTPWQEGWGCNRWLPEDLLTTSLGCWTNNAGDAMERWSVQAQAQQWVQEQAWGLPPACCFASRQENAVLPIMLCAMQAAVDC